MTEKCNYQTRIFFTNDRKTGLIIFKIFSVEEYCIINGNKKLISGRICAYDSRNLIIFEIDIKCWILKAQYLFII